MNLLKIIILLTSFMNHGFGFKQMKSFAIRNNILHASETKNSFWDLLNGNAAIKNEKKANPQLFQSNSVNSKKPAYKLSSIKFTETMNTAVQLFKSKNPSPPAGTSLELTDEELAFRFDLLSKLLKNEKSALQAVINYPDVLIVNPDKCKQIFGIFESKWGFDKALGVIIRNPSLFNIPVSGYGSAETAGDETVFVSYLINVTRPIGKPLLALLLIALLKPSAVAIFNLLH